ncbi:MAG: HAD family hydrolase [Gammaproteobacteria bacterium]
MLKNKDNIKAILFDIDGTLLDTAADLIDAFNIVLTEEGIQPLPYENLKKAAGYGIAKLSEIAYQKTLEPEHIERLRERYLHHYTQAQCQKSCFFPGMQETLSIVKQTRPWGIVTNRLSHMTEHLLPHFPELDHHCLISRDFVDQPKPSPASLLLAAERLNIQPEHCVYICDTVIDIEAARGANMSVIAVNYGYDDEIKLHPQWQADVYVDTPKDILKCLGLLSN